MRLIAKLPIILNSLLLISCMHKGTNPEDPYESVNRGLFKFHMAVDATLIKPPAKLYKFLVPAPVRASVNNFYNNIYLLPTIANDLLQGQWRMASDDAGRLVINSTLGLGGLFDVATLNNLPLHKNDLGLTFAKWGDKKSPYIFIPLLGPSTIRDGMGMVFEYTFLTPYPYIDNSAVLDSLIALRYIDIRSQYLETDHLIDEALDKYSFIRDAYLQNRHYLITGEQATTSESESMYVDGEGANNYIDEAAPTAVKKPAE